MKTFDEIRTMLSEKILLEKKRLKSYSTKANHFDLGNAIARHVQALMAASRNSEIKRIIKKHPKWSTDSYLQERLRATKNMSAAIQHVADDNDSKRPWRPTGQDKKERKERKHKHKHHKDKDKHRRKK